MANGQLNIVWQHLRNLLAAQATPPPSDGLKRWPRLNDHDSRKKFRHSSLSGDYCVEGKRGSPPKARSC
jgi:hypothetical protein